MTLMTMTTTKRMTTTREWLASHASNFHKTFNTFPNPLRRALWTRLLNVTFSVECNKGGLTVDLGLVVFGFGVVTGVVINEDIGFQCRETVGGLLCLETPFFEASGEAGVIRVAPRVD